MDDAVVLWDVGNDDSDTESDVQVGRETTEPIEILKWKLLTVDVSSPGVGSHTGLQLADMATFVNVVAGHNEKVCFRGQDKSDLAMLYEDG